MLSIYFERSLALILNVAGRSVHLNMTAPNVTDVVRTFFQLSFRYFGVFLTNFRFNFKAFEKEAQGLQGKIVGGRDTFHGDYPFLVAIYRNGTNTITT